jgi:hypothetical protein
MAADPSEIVKVTLRERREQLEAKVKAAEAAYAAVKKELQDFKLFECVHPNKRPYLNAPALDLVGTAFSGLMICPDCGHEWFP